MKRIGWAGAIVAVAGLTLATGAEAQVPIVVEGNAGVAVPTGDLADLGEAGPSLGLAAAYEVNPRIRVRAMGALDLLSGVAVDATGFPSRTPDVELWSAGAGVEGRVTPPAWNWYASVVAGGMATSFNTEVFEDLVFDPRTEELVGDFAETYFTGSVGVRVGYAVGSRVDAYVAGEWRTLFADEEDTAVLAELSPDLEAFDSASWFPVTAGFSYRF